MLSVLVSGIAVILITISFFGTNIPVSHAAIASEDVLYKQVFVEDDISMEVPEHWLAIPEGIRADQISPYILNIPLSDALLKANGPLNKELAHALNAYFQSPLSVKTLTILILDSLGKEIEGIFERITFSISPGSSTWQPQNYGFPAYTLAYVPNGQIDDTLIMTIWRYETNAIFVSSVQAVVKNAESAPHTRLVEGNILAPNILGYNSEIIAFERTQEPGKTIIVVTFDTTGNDYFAGGWL